MTLPGDQIPEEALPLGGTNTPAQDAEFAPTWCRHNKRWDYVGEQGGWVCSEDGHNDYDDEGEVIPVATACAIEDGQVYGSPPFDNPTIAALLEKQAIEARTAEIEEHRRRLMGH